MPDAGRFPARHEPGAVVHLATDQAALWRRAPHGSG